jgi:hypothetical protein
MHDKEECIDHQFCIGNVPVTPVCSELERLAPDIPAIFPRGPPRKKLKVVVVKHKSRFTSV